MMNRFLLVLALLSPIFGTTWSTARAADESFCRQYSKAAAETAQRLASCCCRSKLPNDEPPDDKQSTDIEAQYRWCRGVSVDEAKTEYKNQHSSVLTACR
jgi:hypothetical protein